MFSKASKTATATTTTEVKGLLKNAVPSIISADMKIIGSVESGGDIQIDGIVEGDVTSRSVTVSEGATVKGSVSADAVKVAGTIKGGVNAKAVTLMRSAKVAGDILHQTISIETGADFEGSCKRMPAPAPAPEPQKVAVVVEPKPAERRPERALEPAFAR